MKRPNSPALIQARPDRTTGARNTAGEIGVAPIERRQCLAHRFDTNGLAVATALDFNGDG
eukprot:2251719-Alexandrium_andersonii.AAC.1